MSSIWNYRHDLEIRDTEIVGYDVEATDGHIGTIDAATLDTDASHLVVDTGFWIFGHKRVIPAAAVRQVNHADEKVFIDLSKDEVKGAPDHHDTWHEPDHRDVFDAYYESFRWPGF